MNNRNKRKGMEISGSERSDQRERERDRENFLQASSHRTPYPPFKTTMAASILFFGGIILLISGFVVYFKSSPGGDTGISLLACGSISKLHTIILSLSLS